MGLSRDLTARDLAGRPDHLHYGAGAIALRLFGIDNAETRAIVYRWQNELPAQQRPPFLIKIGRHLAAYESRIRAHALEAA